MIEIFISDSIKDKWIAGDSRKHFEAYGIIKCFVAYDDVMYPIHKALRYPLCSSHDSFGI